MDIEETTTTPAIPASTEPTPPVVTVDNPVPTPVESTPSNSMETEVLSTDSVVVGKRERETDGDKEDKKGEEAEDDDDETNSHTDKKKYPFNSYLNGFPKFFNSKRVQKLFEKKKVPFSKLVKLPNQTKTAVFFEVLFFSLSLIFPLSLSFSSSLFLSLSLSLSLLSFSLCVHST